MAEANINFTLRPSFRDLHGRFAAAKNAMLEERRDMLRDEARRYVDLAQDEAPKRSGEFAKTIGFRTFVNNDAAGFKIHMGQPLGKWLMGGTGLYGPLHHLIVPRHAGVLHFFIGNEEFFRHSVRGMKPNKFTGRAYRRWFPGAGAALRKLALRYSQMLTSGGSSGAL